MIQAMYKIGNYLYVIMYEFTGTYNRILVADNTSHTIIYDSSESNEDLVSLIK